MSLGSIHHQSLFFRPQALEPGRLDDILPLSCWRGPPEGLRKAAVFLHHMTSAASHVSQQLCVLPTDANFRIKTQIKLMKSGQGCRADQHPPRNPLNSGRLLDVCFLPFKLLIIKCCLVFQKLLRWLLLLSCSLKHSQAELESKRVFSLPSSFPMHRQVFEPGSLLT